MSCANIFSQSDDAVVAGGADLIGRPRPGSPTWMVATRTARGCPKNFFDHFDRLDRVARKFVANGLSRMINSDAWRTDMR